MGLRNFLKLLLLAALWGPSFLFIKVAVGEIPPFTLVTGRVGIAAVLLYLVLRAQGRNLPRSGRIWRHMAVAAFFSNALPFTLFSWGEIHIDSALAAILNGTTPLFTILLAHFCTTDDRMNAVKFIGMLLGFGGLALLIGPSLVEGVQATTWGLIAVVVAAASYGVAIVYTRQNLRGLPPLVAPTAQLTMATIYLIPLALVFEQPFSRQLPSWPALGSLVALSVIGTAIAFVVYYHLMDKITATSLSMVTYLVPVIGVWLGVTLLNEQPGWNAYAGCALILVGVMVVNGVFKGFNWRRASADVTARP
jgi:drug/metabolite transporter (DMT)-like permease